MSAVLEACKKTSLGLGEQGDERCEGTSRLACDWKAWL